MRQGNVCNYLRRQTLGPKKATADNQASIALGGPRGWPRMGEQVLKASANRLHRSEIQSKLRIHPPIKMATRTSSIEQLGAKDIASMAN